MPQPCLADMLLDMGHQVFIQSNKNFSLSLDTGFAIFYL